MADVQRQLALLVTTPLAWEESAHSKQQIQSTIQRVLSAWVAMSHLPMLGMPLSLAQATSFAPPLISSPIPQLALLFQHKRATTLNATMAWLRQTTAS